MKLATVVGTLTGLAASVALFRSRPTRVDVIRWPEVIDWFARRSRIKASDPDNLAFTLLQRPKVGDAPPSIPLGLEGQSQAGVILVQGFYNQETQRVIECRVIEADDMDPEMAEAHAEQQVLVYE